MLGNIAQRSGPVRSVAASHRLIFLGLNSKRDDAESTKHPVVFDVLIDIDIERIAPVYLHPFQSRNAA